MQTLLDNFGNLMHGSCFLGGACPTYITFRIPQRSALRYVLFGLYTISLSLVITNLNINHHLHADDTNVYIKNVLGDFFDNDFCVPQYISQECKI